MSKAVLISIRPKWCELIASGQKTIEVRKTAPKLSTPFKCYIYETKGKVERPCGDEDGYIYQEGRGAVVGEFVCDHIGKYYYGFSFSEKRVCFSLRVCAQLTAKEVCDYAGENTVYGWHISVLKLYDKSIKLSEFVTRKDCGGYIKWHGLAKPPQSWCYVEELT